jgi:hypothetical protein
MSKGRYTTTAPDPWPQRCCVKCRTPWMCAESRCLCHFETSRPRPLLGWYSWDEVVRRLSRNERNQYLLGPTEFQTRWFVSNLVKPVSGRWKENP